MSVSYTHLDVYKRQSLGIIYKYVDTIPGSEHGLDNVYSGSSQSLGLIKGSRSKKVLVTGGAGYIGAQTVKALSEQGYSVTVFDDLSRGHPCLLYTS